MERLKYIFEKNTQGCIPEVVKLLKLNGIITVSSASAERSFSCLGRVKSYLRSKMNDERLGLLCRISVHKDILQEKKIKSSCMIWFLKSLLRSPGISIFNTGRQHAQTFIYHKASILIFHGS